MHWLLTGGSLFFALLSTWAAIVAHRRSEAAQLAYHKLATLRTRVTSLEGGIESLTAQHRKLSGRFYAMLADLDDPSPDFEGSTERQPERGSPDDPFLQQRLAVCENWAIACDQGPHSPAARCDCAYCNWQRAERARTRARLIPPTAAGQGALAKRNSGQPE